MTTVKCPQCATVNSTDNEFCDNCGAQLPVQAGVASSSSAGIGATPAPTPPITINPSAGADAGLVCPQCQAPLTPGDEFCFNCGHDVRTLTTGNAKPAQAAATPAATGIPAAVTPPPASGGMKDDDLERELAQLKGSVLGTADPGPTLPPVTNLPSLDPAPLTPPPATATPAGNGAAAANPANAFGAPVADPPANAFGVTAPLTTPPSTSTGPATSLKLHVTGPYGDETVEWKGQELLLGRRDPKTRVFPDVNLDDSAASRRHLSIWLESNDSKFYAQDLESANGTSLNGRDLRPGEPTELHNNDVLKVGTRYSIQVRIA